MTTDILARLDEAAARAIDPQSFKERQPPTGASYEVLVNASAWAARRRQAEKEGRDAVRAILSELDAMGWQCVPKDMTDDMHGEANRSGYFRRTTWKAMLAVAPKLEG